MKKFEISHPPSDPKVIESTIQSIGLTIHSKNRLITRPGSIHWHLRKPGERGTLELTLLPFRGLYFSVHKNRRAAWQDRIIRLFKQQLERQHG